MLPLHGMHVKRILLLHTANSEGSSLETHEDSGVE